MRRYNIGKNVEIDGTMKTNETVYDPFDPSDPSQVNDKYVDSSQAVILQTPTYIPERYVFRGWQLLDRTGAETGIYYAPGDEYTIDSTYADVHGVIHFEAAYEPEKETVRRVDVTSLVLDANSGYTVKKNLDVYEDYVYVDLDNNLVNFTKQVNNFDVKLHDYYDNFGHSDGYMLLGWDTDKQPENYIPRFAADAVVGVDSTDDNNTLYAIWEPMYYLNLQNYSTDYNITFNLKFTGYDGSTVYSGDTNTVVSTFEREVFSTLKDTSKSVYVTKNGDGDFTVTMKKAESNENPTTIKLVLPQGANAKYTVSGTVNNAVNDSSQSLATIHNKLSVYNSGGAGEELTWNGSAYNGAFYNLNNSTATSYSVSGDMKIGSDGQYIAFYTDEAPSANIEVESKYYDLASGQWLSGTKTTGPCATLHFDDAGGIGGEPTVVDNVTTGYSNLKIVKNSANTFYVNQSFTNTDEYKFIGWYTVDEAAPDTTSLDGKTSIDDVQSKVSGITIPNTDTTYYALYVPKADGNLVITHDEKSTSIGYPKKIAVSANYNNVDYTDSVTTQIVNIAEREGRVHTEINVPVKESEAGNNITITLQAMAGYGCVYYTTYEGLHELLGSAVKSDTPEDVHINPSDNTSDAEQKYLYTYTINTTVDSLFENSETVKGLKVLKTLDYYSDFKRNYEFVYNYVFRDGTTQRKYLVKGETAELNSESDFEKFVLESAPYINNFGEDFAWNPSTITVSNLYGKGKVTASMSAVQSKNAKAVVKVKRYGSDVTIPWTVDIGSAFPEDERPTAELIVDNKQFLRWKISETDSGDLVGYCYYHEFTFKVWEDYTITPEYTELQDDGEYHRIYPNDENDAYVKLDYLESSRNQWVNLDDDGNIEYDENGNATYNDSLISDFSMIFIDHGNRINSNPENYKVGLLFEIAGKIESEGSEAVDYGSNDELRLKAINAVINNSNNKSGTIKAGGLPKFYYSQFDPSDLNDDNRLEYYRGIDNILNKDGSLNPNATYIFNVYAFMRLPDGTILQSEPVNLQMHNLAIKTITG